MGKKRVVPKLETSVEGVSKPTSVSQGKKNLKIVESGRIYINISYNNTIITVTDNLGNVIAWISAGSMGFSGPKKATSFAAQRVVSALAEKISKTGPFNVNVFICGVGGGRDSALRSLINRGFNILSVKDITPIPHNGPKPPKRRRV